MALQNGDRRVQEASGPSYTIHTRGSPSPATPVIHHQTAIRHQDPGTTPNTGLRSRARDGRPGVRDWIGLHVPLWYCCGGRLL
ncbi:unnamed protein product [Boreogadus saida]